MSELSVDIKANTDAAVSQVKKLGSAFEDTATDMEKLVDAGQGLGKSTDDIARDLSKLDGPPFDEVRREVERADQSIDDMGDEADDARKTLDKLSDAGDDIGDKVTRGTDKAKAGMEDFKSEAQQTARESAASFDGSAESIGDAFQEVAANAFSGFGPLGAAAGLAAAAGIGLVGAELGKQQEQIAELKQRFADMYQSAAEEGLNYISIADVISNTNDLMFNPDRANEWKDAQAEALQIGIDSNTVALARNGHEESLETVLAAVSAKRDEVKAKAEEGGSTAIRMAVDEVNALSGVQAQYENIRSVHDANQENLQRANAINAGLHESERAQIQRTRDADQARYEAMAARYSQGVTIPVKVDSSAWDNYSPQSKTAYVNTVTGRTGRNDLDFWE